MKKYAITILAILIILSLGYFLFLDHKQPNKNQELKTPTIKESTQNPNQILNNQTAGSGLKAKITYFDICREKAKKFSSFYLINDKT